MKELHLKDDWLLGEVMKNPEVCRMILEKILGMKLAEVGLVNSQQVIHDYFESKGIRLDLYAMDMAGNIYDIEIQVEPDELPKRSRFYQAALDLSQLKPGQFYKELKSTYIVFICCFDIGGQGKFRYTMGSFCEDNKDIKFEDGMHRIFLNTRGTQDDVDEELREFLHYIENSTQEMADKCKGELVRRVHEETEKIRNQRGKGTEYMLYSMKFMEAEAKGMAKGKAEGKAEERRLLATKMYKAGMHPGQITEITGASLEEVQRWMAGEEQKV